MKMHTRPDISINEIPKRKDLNLSIKVPIDNKSKFERRISILGARVSHEQLFINQHKIDKLKTSVLIDKDRVAPIKGSHQQNKLAEVKSYRPIRSISQKSASDSPVEVMTPGGTLLHRVSRVGGLSIFSNDKSASPVVNFHAADSVLSGSKFLKSESFQSIVEPASQEKSAEEKVTYEKLEKQRNLDKENDFKRTKTQHEVMVKSGINENKARATEYVYATEIFDDDSRWEWLHLVAHMIKGKLSQDKNNFVVGTAYSNTEMMFIEGNLRYLATHYKEGIKIMVKAQLIPQTHIAKTLEYIITTPDFKIVFDLNPQARNKPHIDYQDYFNVLFDGLIEKEDKHYEKNANHLFFSKAELARHNIPVVGSQEPMKEPMKACSEKL